jgi:hypothetical protein
MNKKDLMETANGRLCPPCRLLHLDLEETTVQREKKSQIDAARLQCPDMKNERCARNARHDMKKRKTKENNINKKEGERTKMHPSAPVMPSKFINQTPPSSSHPLSHTHRVGG